MESGEALTIKGAGRGKKDNLLKTKIKVNARGSLVIPKVLVESMEIGADQIFEVKKTASGISLKTVKETETEAETDTEAENTENLTDVM